MNNNSYLQGIEQSFAMLISKKGSPNKELKKIGDNLSKLLYNMYKKECKFTVDVCSKEPHSFFGMSIYPSINTMDSVLDALFEPTQDIESLLREWNICVEWVIEIDNELLYNNNLNINPSEATAVLLHEVGHIIGTNSIPLRLQKVIRNKLTTLNLKARTMVEMQEFRPILLPTIIEACSSKVYKYVGTREELAADRYVVSLGYGPQLNAFIDKLIKSMGNSLLQTTEKEAMNDINNVLNWTIDSITEMQYRKTKLRHSLNAELLSNPSKFAKRVITVIRDKFFSAKPATAYGVFESSVFTAYDQQKKDEYYYKRLSDKADQIVTEALFGGKNKKLKKIDPLDIDYINIEIDKIVNYDDKLYVLDLIYYQMSLIDKALEMISNGMQNMVQNNKNELERYKDELNRLRQRAANVKILKRNPLDINIRVDYPRGFEG